MAKNHIAQVETAIALAIGSLPTKSAQIREMHAQGFDNMTISKTLSAIHYPDGKKEVRYQHVRNVLNQKLAGE